jgi:RNA polymerase sigma factor (sigma-70 family)
VTTTAEPDPRQGLDTSWNVRRAVAGDSQSIGWLVERFAPLLEAQARYRLASTPSSQATPEDVVHDAWLATLPRLGRFVARDGRFTPVLLSYLGKSVCGLATNHLKKYLTREARQRAVLPARAGTETGVSAEIAAHIRSVASLAAASELHHRIAALIAGLDPGARDVLILRGIEGRTNGEAAVELGEKPNTVAQRYKRALGELRARLPQSVFDELIEA